MAETYSSPVSENLLRRAREVCWLGEWAVPVASGLHGEIVGLSESVGGLNGTNVSE